MKEGIRSFFFFFSKGAGWILGICIGFLLIGVSVLLFSSRGPLGSGGKYVLQTSSNANGVFVEPSLDKAIFLELYMRGEMNGKNLSRKEIEGALDYATQVIGKRWRGISALVLHIDSPGGIAKEGFDLFDCLAIWKQREQIPVYVFVNGLCASAAFFVSCVADKIFAQTISLIGSIGVVSPCFSVGEVLDRIGIEVKLISAGTGKTDLNYLLPLEEEGIVRRQELVDEVYDIFLQHVSFHRGLPLYKLQDEVGARIFLADDALDLGLIDEVVTGRSSCLRSIEILQGTSDASVVRVEKSSTLHSQLENILQSFHPSSLFSWHSLL